MKVTAVTFTNARSTKNGAAACVKTQTQDGDNYKRNIAIWRQSQYKSAHFRKYSS